MSIKINLSKQLLSSVLTAAICVSLTACSDDENKTSSQGGSQVNEQASVTQPITTQGATQNIDIWPVLDFSVKKSPNVEAKVAGILRNMTLEQKVAQMIQPEIRDISVEDMRKQGIGSYFNGGGAFPGNNKP